MPTHGTGETGLANVRIAYDITRPQLGYANRCCSFRCARRRRGPGDDLGERGIAGVAAALDRAEAARRFELPFDREADFVVLGDADTAIGAAHADHDLSGLAGHRLRSQCGQCEQRVPFIRRNR